MGTSPDIRVEEGNSGEERESKLAACRVGVPSPAEAADRIRNGASGGALLSRPNSRALGHFRDLIS